MSNGVPMGIFLPAQQALDKKLWYKSLDDVTLGQDNYLAFCFHKGMLIYCADERVFYEWTDKEGVNRPDENRLLINDFTYPADYPVVDNVNYASKTYNFYKAKFDPDLDLDLFVKHDEFTTAIADLNQKITKNTAKISELESSLGQSVVDINDAIAALKDYTDAKNEVVLKELELKEKALREELTDAEARTLLELENQKRLLEQQIASQSELLVQSVEELQNKLNQEVSELNTALDNLSATVNSLPTNVDLTKAQMDNLRYIAKVIDSEYRDVNFKINVVLRDKFLPETEKPAILDLQLECRQKNTALQNAITSALQDGRLTEAEITDINNKIDDFRDAVNRTNDHLLDVYELLGTSMDDYYINMINAKMTDVSLTIEYSVAGTGGWHPEPIKPEDYYMRMKNGTHGAWSDPILIRGEEGQDGIYQSFQFAIGDSLTSAPTSGWQDVPPPINAVKPYQWCRTGTVTPPATTPPTWTAFCMSGPAGPPGEVTGTEIGPTEPTDREIGMVWIDTSKSPIEQKYWDGNMWILIGLTKNDITNAIQDATSELETTMREALEDGIISASEANMIASNINTLKTTKRMLDSQTTIIRNDRNLGTTEKQNLDSAKSAFDVKHNNLIAICETIASQTSVTPEQVTAYNTAYSEYTDALDLLTRRLEEAQSNILANSIAGIQVGGRNLYILSQLEKKKMSSTTVGVEFEANKLASEKDAINKNLMVINGKCVISLGNSAYKATVYKFDNAGKLLSGVSNLTSATSPLKLEDVLKLAVVLSKTDGSNIDLNTVGDAKLKVEKGNVATDWTIAPEDIDEQIGIAILNAANAEAIANAARDRVNFLSVSIDPDIGLIIGSTLMVGNSEHGNAFITGVTDQFDEDGNDISIRFGAGPGGYVNKETVPFRVNDKGELFASRGEIAGWQLTPTAFKYEYSATNEGKTVIELNPTTGGISGIGYTKENPSTLFDKSTARKYDLKASQKGVARSNLFDPVANFENYSTSNISTCLTIGAGNQISPSNGPNKIPYYNAWMKEFIRTLTIPGGFRESNVLAESIEGIGQGDAITVAMGNVTGKVGFQQFITDSGAQRPLYTLPAITGFTRGIAGRTDSTSGWKATLQYEMINKPSGSLDYVSFNRPPSNNVEYIDIDVSLFTNYEIEQAFAEGRYIDVLVDNSSGQNVEIQTRFFNTTRFSVERFIIPNGKSKVTFMVIREDNTNKMKMVVFVFPTI